jgi:cysteine-rich repeat protein
MLCVFATFASCGARSGLLDSPIAFDVTDVRDIEVPADLSLPVDLPPVRDDRPPQCGNALVEAGEQCDLGARNALVSAFALSQPGRPEVALAPVVRRVNVAAFYRYQSASAHTGFEQVGAAHVLLYVNALDNDLGLVFFAGRDGDDGTTPPQPESAMDFIFRGVPAGAQIALSDDVGEFTRALGGEVRGRWTYRENTDGGALAQIPWNTPWRIVIEGAFASGVTSLRAVQRDGRLVALSSRDSVVIEHRVAHTGCRTDCRVPRCGDAFVDAGERCDDGNNRSGDGCASDCLRIE